MFTAYRTPIERATIEVLSIRPGERKVLLTGGVYGFYVPTGHLLYAVGETIRARAVRSRSARRDGRPPFPVVDSVAMNLTDGAAAFDVSENGHAGLPAGQLLRHRDRSGAGGPEGQRIAGASDARSLQQPAPLPDGSRIAVDIRSANSMGDVWVFQVGRSGGTRLTSEGGRDFGAEWTPDGRELIYSSERPYFDLYRRAADASRPARTAADRRPTTITPARSPAMANCLRSSLSGPRRRRALDRFRCRASRSRRAISRTGSTWRTPRCRRTAAGWRTTPTSRVGVEVYIQSFPDPQLKRGRFRPRTDRSRCGRGADGSWCTGRVTA